ncbi:MAG: hypothetical protein JW738_07955 [Actinobacteria bacterium]|nr:hypothetical protein [Actinomycetota bacterium]
MKIVTCDEANAKVGNMKKLLVLVMLAAVCLAACSCGVDKSKQSGEVEGLEYVSSYPETPADAADAPAQGNLYKAGKINVLVLSGTYREMGEQYGELLKSDLTKIYEKISGDFGKVDGVSYEELLEIGNVIYDKYPQRYQEIVEGIADSSGLGMDKAKILNAQEAYVYAALVDMMKKKQPQCSGMAVWDSYTSEGPLVFGRNYDLGPVNAEYATVTVYNPVDGNLPTANFTFAGCIYVTSGMNSKGLFLELNNGSTSDPSDFTESRLWAPASLFSFLENAENVEQLAYWFSTTNPDLAYIVNAADKKTACSFEWATFGVKQRQPDRAGILVATNHFADPAWEIPPPSEDPDFSVQRRENLLAMGEKYKGRFDAKKMMEVISTPVEDGGAFRAPNLTSFEIVAVPAELTIWVRVPEVQDWVGIDLGALFRK